MKLCQTKTNKSITVRSYNKVLTEIKEGKGSFPLFNLEEFVYSGTAVKSIVTCKLNNHRHEKSVTKMRAGFDCAYCKGKVKITSGMFQASLNKKHGDGKFKLIGEYQADGCEIEHITCECLNPQTLNTVTHSIDTCQNCASNKKSTTDQFQEDIDKEYGKGEYVVLGKYVTNTSPIQIVHLSALPLSGR